MKKIAPPATLVFTEDKLGWRIWGKFNRVENILVRPWQPGRGEGEDILGSRRA